MKNSVDNIAYSAYIGGGEDIGHITVEDAAITLANWKAEGMEDIDDVTPEMYAAAWNAMYDYFHR